MREFVISSHGYKQPKLARYQLRRGAMEFDGTSSRGGEPWSESSRTSDEEVCYKRPRLRVGQTASKGTKRVCRSKEWETRRNCEAAFRIAHRPPFILVRVCSPNRTRSAGRNAAYILRDPTRAFEIVNY
ncbi:uncharacterized protein LOC112453344 [Temnothorax curvispinosus]|uniref:Uncharacterized protein LOC112453344 n=1 Tax=Temnothorax curvispinosus TaxID=300111 RepID=A0A6J1PJQ4_9HYME|nr:uncharacterized protein LOC112453344 [Temnothorax curvispinosus]